MLEIEKVTISESNLEDLKKGQEGEGKLVNLAMCSPPCHPEVGNCGPCSPQKECGPNE